MKRSSVGVQVFASTETKIKKDEARSADGEHNEQVGVLPLSAPTTGRQRGTAGRATLDKRASRFGQWDVSHRREEVQ